MSRMESQIANIQQRAGHSHEELLEFAEAVNKGEEGLGSFAEDAAFVIAVQAGGVDRAAVYWHWIDTLLGLAKHCKDELMAYTRIHPTGIASCKALATRQLGRLGRVEYAYDPIRVILHAAEGESITRFLVRSDTPIEDYLTMNLDIDDSATTITLGLVELWKLDEIFHPHHAANKKSDGLEFLEGGSLAKYFAPPTDLLDGETFSLRHLVLGTHAVLRDGVNSIDLYGDVSMSTATLCVLIRQGFNLSAQSAFRNQIEWIDTHINKHTAACQTRIDELKAEMKELQQQLSDAKSKQGNIDPQLLAGVNKYLRPWS